MRDFSSRSSAHVPPETRCSWLTWWRPAAAPLLSILGSSSDIAVQHLRCVQPGHLSAVALCTNEFECRVRPLCRLVTIGTRIPSQPKKASSGNPVRDHPGFQLPSWTREGVANRTGSTPGEVSDVTRGPPKQTRTRSKHESCHTPPNRLSISVLHTPRSRVRRGTRRTRSHSPGHPSGCLPW